MKCRVCVCVGVCLCVHANHASPGKQLDGVVLCGAHTHTWVKVGGGWVEASSLLVNCPYSITH